jgi:hypothetical protein
MANAPLTHSMVAREAAAMLEELSPFVRNVNKARQDEFGEDISGYKKGSSVRIKLPPTGVVYDGATFAGGGSAPDFVEASETLTLDTQKHAGLTFTAKEKLLDITEFKERILMPQMITLAASVEAAALQLACLATPNKVGTVGTTPTTMKLFNQARQKMQRSLTPNDPRYMMYTDDVGPELIDASKALFSPVPEIQKQFYEGSIGKASGAAWYECVNLPTQAVGTRAGAITVSGASQVGASITVACTSGDTFKKGEIVTFAGAIDVHPLTGTAYGTSLKQFVITADTTASGSTVALPIYPSIDVAMPNQTVAASPTNSGAVTFGYSSAAHKESLMWHKDAFTMAFAPLPVLASCEGYTARLPSGVSVRVMTGGNFNADTESTRIDVLYGFSKVRAMHACRVAQ